MPEPIRTPFTPPAAGEAVPIAEGVLWIRMPLAGPLSHVNCYAFDDGDGWSVVDTGVDTPELRALWAQIMAGPMGGKAVTRVIATHHHLDHIGLAGWFMAQGATLVATRTSYLMARMLKLDVQERATPEQVGFWRACGMAPDLLAARIDERPFNTADFVAPIPLGYARVREGDRIRFGARNWVVRTGDGHAPEHATFWEAEGPLVVGGDQLLGSISPNIGVHATEPEADTVGDWLDSCTRLGAFAREDHLVLTGHRQVYTGLPARIGQLVDNHHRALARLREALDRPRTACDCFEALFGRQVGPGEYGLAMVEAMAHCLHLWRQGVVSRTLRDDGAVLWQTRSAT